MWRRCSLGRKDVTDPWRLSKTDERVAGPRGHSLSHLPLSLPAGRDRPRRSRLPSTSPHHSQGAAHLQSAVKASEIKLGHTDRSPPVVQLTTHCGSRRRSDLRRATIADERHRFVTEHRSAHLSLLGALSPPSAMRVVAHSFRPQRRPTNERLNERVMRELHAPAREVTATASSAFSAQPGPKAWERSPCPAVPGPPCQQGRCLAYVLLTLVVTKD